MVNGLSSAPEQSPARAARAVRRSPRHLLGESSVLLGLLAFALSLEGQDPAALLRRADRVRNAWPEAAITLRVTSTRPGAPAATGEFLVESKGERSRLTFRSPADAGKFVVTNGDDSWLILPNTRNPIRIPRSQRLHGGFSAAEMSKTRFSDDYDAVFERSDVLDGRECAVLRLTGKKGRHPTYPVARVWIDLKEGLYRKAVFLVGSGKTAKVTTFDEYKVVRGNLSLARMTIVDELRPGKTVVEYLDFEKKSLPDSIFEPKGAP